MILTHCQIPYSNKLLLGDYLPDKYHPSLRWRLGQIWAILSALATAPITSVHNGIGGTQLKLLVTLAGGQRVVFKPKWYERDYILEGPANAGRDRHNGEVAAFHLSRIMGLRKTPIAVGRFISLTRELIPVASDSLRDSLYEDDEDTCFTSLCRDCDKENTYCTPVDDIEGTIIMWLPRDIRLKTSRNPWRKSFIEKLLAKLEPDEDEAYCDIVRRVEPFNSSTHLLLDLIDATVFDYLIGNADRHHYEVVAGIPDGMLIMLDNGKSFGNPYEDEHAILAPLFECCVIRSSTWRRLLSLSNNVLSAVLREVLRADPLDPVLTTQHFQALDRRLGKVLQEVQTCIQNHGLSSVLVNTPGEQLSQNSDIDDSRIDFSDGGSIDSSEDYSQK